MFWGTELGCLWGTVWNTSHLFEIAMAADKRHLMKHGYQWVVVVKVPDRVRHIVGRAHLKRPLLAIEQFLLRLRGGLENACARASVSKRLAKRKASSD